MTKTPSTPRLSAQRLLILQTAAQRRTRIVLPLPAEVRMAAGRIDTLLKSLLRAGLVEERSTRAASLAWRQNADGRSVTLRITDAGVRAVTEPLATEPGTLRPSVAQQDIERSEATSQAQGRPAGKLGQVLQAISQDDGATLAELISLTSWQPHTTRAALSRLRQRGFMAQLNEQNGRKSYRLAATAHG